jgi:hypothetical protein
MGFLGTFLVSLVVTPLPVLVVLLLTGPSRRHVTYPPGGGKSAGS